VWAAAYGYTLGGPVGLAQVSHEGGLPEIGCAIRSLRFRHPTAIIRHDCRCSHFYDPARTRILDVEA
jgi:hypothetical protein